MRPKRTECDKANERKKERKKRERTNDEGLVGHLLDEALLLALLDVKVEGGCALCREQHSHTRGQHERPHDASGRKWRGREMRRERKGEREGKVAVGCLG